MREMIAKPALGVDWRIRQRTVQIGHMRVSVLVLDHAFDSSVSLTLDLLAAANRVRQANGRRPLFTVERLGWERRSAVTGLGFRLRLDADAQDRRTEALLLPGLNLVTLAEVRAWLRRPATQRLAAWVAGQHSRGALVLASCVSTFLAAESGILDGHAATTSWFLAPGFRERYPRVLLDERRAVVWARRAATAGAAFSQVDLMLSFLRSCGGVGLTQTCMSYLAVTTQASQSRHMMIDHLARATPDVLAAERWVATRLSAPIPIATLARALHLSPRTLDRRVRSATGMSPLRFVQRLRVEAAAQLLDTTSLSFDQVSTRVGYRDPAAFRRIFKRELGMTARELRRPTASVS
jgi:transcriptional regulator GlxA family with amidase domain